MAGSWGDNGDSRDYGLGPSNNIIHFDFNSSNNTKNDSNYFNVICPDHNKIDLFTYEKLNNYFNHKLNMFNLKNIYSFKKNITKIINNFDNFFNFNKNIYY